MRTERAILRLSGHEALFVFPKAGFGIRSTDPYPWIRIVGFAHGTQE